MGILALIYDLPHWVWVLFLTYAVAWLFTLGDVLQHDRFNPIERLTQVIVVVFVPVVRIICYVALSRKKCPSRVDSLTGTPWEHDSGHRLKR